MSSWGAFLSFASFLFFIGVIAYSLFYGKRVTGANYWNEHADTLEWTLPTPAAGAHVRDAAAARGLGPFPAH